MKKYLSLILAVILVLVGAGSSLAASPPPYLTYQGHLYDATGAPVVDGDYALAFSLWAHGVGDEIPLWGPETYTLAVSHGYFAVTLGQGTPLPALPSPVYLEITVNGETLSPRQPVQSVAFALNAQESVTLNGQAADYYRDWNYTLNLPAGFADGVDNDTVYTDADALAAVAAAGYLTQTGAFTDAQTLNGQPGSYYLSWGNLSGLPAGFADGVDNDTHYTAGSGLSLSGAQFSVTGAPWGGLTGVPAGFADGVDDDTVYTDSQAIAAVAGVGYVTAPQVETLIGAADVAWGQLSGVPADFADGVDNDTVYTDADAVNAVDAAGYVTGDEVIAIITDTGTLTLTVSYAETAGGAAALDGQSSAYYLDAGNINAGTLGSAYYSAAGDLATEGYLDNNAATDLLTQGQGDGRYVNAGEAGSVTGAMLGDGATLGEILDDDGAGSGLDSDLLDGQSGAYYLAWGNQTGVPAGFADGTDNDTTYSAGTGLSLSGTQFSANTTYLQRRVSSTCAVGSSIRAINADGTVTCETTTAAAAPGLPIYSRTVLESGAGIDPAVTIGADGLALISYFDQTSYDLKVAHCTDVACTGATLTTLDSTGNVGWSSSVAIGADGLGLISYYDTTNGNLKVAHCTDGACTSATLTTLDSAGDVGTFSSIAIGADGLALISYYDYSNGNLKVAHCSNVACTSAAVTTLDSAGDVGAGTALVIGVDGLGFIAYNDNTNSTVKVAHCSNVACASATLSVLDSAAAGGYSPAVTLGRDGFPLIGYRGISNGLKTAHCTDVACTSAGISTLVSGTLVNHLHLVLGDDGLGLLIYLDETGSWLLKAAHCTDTACTTATSLTVDSVGSSFNAVTIGTDGMPLLSYFDATNGNLIGMHCSNVFCTPYARAR